MRMASAIEIPPGWALAGYSADPAVSAVGAVLQRLAPLLHGESAARRAVALAEAVAAEWQEAGHDAEALRRRLALLDRRLAGDIADAAARLGDAEDEAEEAVAGALPSRRAALPLAALVAARSAFAAAGQLL